MSDRQTVSTRLDGEQVDQLEDIATSNQVSRSEVLREAVQFYLANSGELPDHINHDAQIRRLISEHKEERRKGKFRREFSNQLQNSFERGEHPDEFEHSVAGYIEESKKMGELPPGVKEETGFSTYYEWVQRQLEYYRVAYESQEFSHDPVNDPLGQHEGLSNAKEWIEAAETIAGREGDQRRGDTAQEKREQTARLAMQDGIVPESLEDRARQSDRKDVEVIAEEAVDLVERSEGLTPGESNSELISGDGDG